MTHRTKTAPVKVREVMRKEVATLSPDDAIETALESFEEAGISGAPVVDMGGRLVGVLTLADVARTEHLKDDRLSARRGGYEMGEPVGEEFSDELDPDEVFYVKEDYSSEALGRDLVGDWMTREVVSVGPDEDLAQACRAMADRKIHRVFVTDQEKLVGMITSFDVVRWVARDAASSRPARC